MVDKQARDINMEDIHSQPENVSSLQHGPDLPCHALPQDPEINAELFAIKLRTVPSVKQQVMVCVCTWCPLN
jgi:hypothetical protein